MTDTQKRDAYEWAWDQLTSMGATVIEVRAGFDVYLPRGPHAGMHHAHNELALAQLVRDMRNPL